MMSGTTHVLLTLTLACVCCVWTTQVSAESDTELAQPLPPSQHLSPAYHHHNGKARVKRRTTSSVTCDSRSRYSRIDGYCHNLQHPAWGAAGTPLKREEYLTSQQTPRLTSSSGRPLPSPRLVSTTYHSPLDDRSDVTLMLMQFGQFLDHDITLTPNTELDASINCCTSSNEACLPISIPSDDEHFQGLDCMVFVRSERHTDTELSTPTLQQSNAHTSYIDGSMIYGSSEAELDIVRDFSNNDGLLKITDLSNGDYLPDGPNTACEADQSAGEYCFLAGDERVNEQAGLAAMHTIFMREHNRIARKLKAENSRWSGNTIFKETRKIMGAVIQKIANDDFHPLVLGTKNQQMEEYKYNAHLQANILNSFATAAYRFGHSLIPEELVITGHGSVLFKDLFNDPTMVLDALDGLTDTLKDDPAMGADGRFSHSITRHLFETEPKTGFDLVALNIQRGRDHHIPTYNRMRELCGLPRVRRLSDLFGRRYDNVYESIDDVDLFTGGMTERPVEGGLVGETFACVLNDQFHRLRMGDRLWYENTEGQAAFSNNQIEEIKKMSLAKIICENSENKRVQRNIFKPATSGRGGNNPNVDCEDIADINIDRWRGAVSDNGNGNGGDGVPPTPVATTPPTSGGDVTWKVTVVTRDRRDAGTDGIIKLKMFGNEGKKQTNWLPLNVEGRNDFERGQTDVFKVTTDNVGRISTIILFLYPYSDTWFGSKVTVEGDSQSFSVYINCSLPKSCYLFCTRGKYCELTNCED